ncbi:hypothetical protein [Owenweeksia hongkongensis]|uniref:hypothetical protein n=1 Tax=Owenweeksia hongkongensis TaxID=253245 RepID=UPI003A92074D
MKKKNTLYTVLNRTNLWKPIFLDVIVTFSSYPALLIELFTRFRFGQRYFSLSSCFMAIALLFVFGVAYTGWQDFFAMLMGIRPNEIKSDGYEYPLLLFCVAALVASIVHKRELMANGQTIDFKRYSKSNGQPRDYWYRLSKVLPDWWLEKLPLTPENIWRYYEPLAAGLIGLLLLPLPFTRLLGLLIFVCALFYYWRTSIQYSWGYHHMLDVVDEMMVGEYLRDFMTDDSQDKADVGVNVYVPMPNDTHLKQKLIERMQQKLDGPKDDNLNA